MTLRRALRILTPLVLSLSAIVLPSCSTPAREVRVSVRDQKVALYERGEPVRVYDCSTSKYGIGDEYRSNRTPLGKMRVVKKIGSGQPPGMVFSHRQATGEVLRPDAPGRDPIVSRILWLSGSERKNRNAYGRYIYIHGTPEERNIGQPASFGCVRMRSMDVIDLFNRVPTGTQVKVERGGLPGDADDVPVYAYSPPVRAVTPTGPIVSRSGSVAKR